MLAIIQRMSAYTITILPIPRLITAENIPSGSTAVCAAALQRVSPPVSSHVFGVPRGGGGVIAEKGHRHTVKHCHASSYTFSYVRNKMSARETPILCREIKAP